MNESIYISNYRNNVDKISDYISTMKKNSKFSFLPIHQKDDILRIDLKNHNYFNPSLIEKYELTCVIENDLYKTVYLNGTRVLWKSIHD